PILQHTRDVFFLGDGEIAVLTKDSVRVTDFEGNPVEPHTQRITWDPIMAEKGGFKHFMLKEIYEQPRAVRDTMQGGVSLDAALREAKERGSKVLAICNVQGSMVTREADGTILTHAGPEIGVASTKAFTAQMVALYLFAMYLGQLRGTLSEDEARRHAQQLAE